MRGAFICAVPKQEPEPRPAMTENEFYVIYAPGQVVSAGAVAIVGGAWSEMFARQLGVSIPVAPQRGQIIHLDLRGTDLDPFSITRLPAMSPATS
jgi:glycine/D-amino acid oxidase-like deaminating enzyme